MTVHLITLHAAYLKLHYSVLAADVNGRRQYVLMGMSYSGERNRGRSAVLSCCHRGLHTDGRVTTTKSACRASRHFYVYFRVFDSLFVFGVISFRFVRPDIQQQACIRHWLVIMTCKSIGVCRLFQPKLQQIHKRKLHVKIDTQTVNTMKAKPRSLEKKSGWLLQVVKETHREINVVAYR